jgi:hypothetical protein
MHGSQQPATPFFMVILIFTAMATGCLKSISVLFTLVAVVKHYNSTFIFLFGSIAVIVIKRESC